MTIVCVSSLKNPFDYLIIVFVETPETAQLNMSTRFPHIQTGRKLKKNQQKSIKGFKVSPKTRSEGWSPRVDLGLNLKILITRNDNEIDNNEIFSYYQIDHPFKKEECFGFLAFSCFCYDLQLTKPSLICF